MNRKAERANAFIELLAERWPAVFSIYEVRRRPLKLGIHLDILAALDGAVTPKELKFGLSRYCNNAGYLRACCREGATRVDLDGNAAGAVSSDDAKRAVERLAAHKKLRQQRVHAKAVMPKESAPAMPARPMVVEPWPARLSLGVLKRASLRRRQSEAV